MENWMGYVISIFLGHYDINQVEMFTSSDTKMVLSIGHSYINQMGISAHH